MGIPAIRSAQQAARPSPARRRARSGSRRPGFPVEPLRIVHITAECWPFARTGGLGEAVAGLAASQAKSGAEVTVVMPLYRVIRDSAAALRPIRPSLTVITSHGPQAVQLYETPRQPGRPRMIFIDHAESFDRNGIYGEDGADYPDNGHRFALLSSAAIEWVSREAPAARVIHAHDWHAAPALAYLRSRDAETRQVLCVLSIHNAAFQGLFDLDCLALPAMDGGAGVHQAFEWYGRANYLKGGLAWADLTVAVSPNHAVEIRTREGGFGLHEQFAMLGDRLVGILNGVDTEVWDPGTDPHIPLRYWRTRMGGKAVCKAALQRECRLRESPSTTLFAMCTRLTEQKGIDIVLRADPLRLSHAQFLFVGRGERRYEESLATLAAAAPDRIALRLDFSDALEHRVIAGADALLMPSQFEPCGLTQMRAQRYGTIPLVRRVGGLADTVVDNDTGFVFGDYTPEAFAAALGRAKEAHARKRQWREMARRAMLGDFGWARAAAEYTDHYRAAFSRLGTP